MKWVVVDEDRDMFVSITNSLPCPPSNSRRLEPSLRTTPELPENMVTVTKGTLPPAKVNTVRQPSVAMPPPTKPEHSDDPPKTP